MKIHRICRRICWLALAQIVVLAAGLIPAPGALAGNSPADEATPSELPAGKQTTLGLYATAAEAFEAWSAAPGEVTILDVRTPEEFMFVGHPDMAWNVPVFMQTLDWDEEKARFKMEPTADFVSRVMRIVEPADTVYLVCRSGGRSAMAVDMLAEAGFENAFSVTDGMEGGKVKDENSPDFGHRTLNGWKNSDLPWTYKVDHERVVLPESD